MSIEIDKNRVVKAVVLISDTIDYGNLQPGQCRKQGSDRIFFACPGCAAPHSVRCGNPKPTESPSWDIIEGNVEDITTLTLMPSILCCGCCNWHGYLVKGVFQLEAPKQ